MPIKLSDEVRTQFDTNLSTIKKFNAKDLIRRDELGSELNFADAETDFETAINLFEQDMVALRATMHIGFLVVKEAAFASLK